MYRAFLVAAVALSSAHALAPHVPPTKFPVHSFNIPRAATPTMKKCSGGASPRKDKFSQKSRGALRKIVFEADSAEKVQTMLLSPTTEALLLKMNWKKRMSQQYKIKARAAEFGVEVPAGFASWQVKPRSAKKHLLQLSTN